MKRVLTLGLLFLAGCAAQDGERLAGRQQKDDGPVRIERLGTLMLLDKKEQFACSAEQVLWCVGGAPDAGADCRCVYVDRAERRFDILLGKRTQR